MRVIVSVLVRENLRELHFDKRAGQAKAMQNFVGIRKNRSEPLDAVVYVKGLCRGDRLDRLHNN